MPQHNWNYDPHMDEHYLLLRGDNGTFDMRPGNTLLYLFDDHHRKVDHIFRKTNETEEAYMGFRIWRSLIDKVLGDEGFDDLTWQMQEHGFDVAPDSEPSQLDVDAYEKYTGQDYEPDYEAHDKLIVMRAAKNLDDHWRYVEPEWRAEQGYGPAY